MAVRLSLLPFLVCWAVCPFVVMPGVFPVVVFLAVPFSVCLLFSVGCPVLLLAVSFSPFRVRFSVPVACPSVAVSKVLYQRFCYGALALSKGLPVVYALPSHCSVLLYSLTN